MCALRAKKAATCTDIRREIPVANRASAGASEGVCFRLVAEGAYV
jgi:hypothetical protein